MHVFQMWKLDRSKPLQEQRFAPCLKGRNGIVRISGMEYFTTEHDMGYVGFVTSKNEVTPSSWIYLNQHYLAAFCRKFLLAYDGGWVLRKSGDDGGWLYWRDWPRPGEWVSNMEMVTIYNTELFDEVDSSPWSPMPADMAGCEFVPVAIAGE